ncbi:MAG: flagellar biosynthesis anti-sigma factor FlgM [Lachnospiraceae bacterium]|nr:flagellar biosynthesis anti-sigma factor FlgM [Lachnospiraceae bacterium]
MMRIDAYNQVLATYKPQSVKPKARVNNQSTIVQDRLQISSFGQDLAIAKNAVKNAPDIREDKVSEMTDKYGTDGQTPSIDMDDFASVLLAKYQGAF